MSKSANKVLCSTGTMLGRPNGRDYNLLREYLGRLCCDGFEFMMYDSWYDKLPQLLDFLLSLDVEFPVMHCEKHIGELLTAGDESSLKEAFERFEKNCSVAEKIGADRLVLHLWNGIISDSRFENNLKAYAQLDRIAKAHGVDVLTENVVCHDGEPMAHWRELAQAYPQAHFIYDTKMAAFHCQDELIYSDEYAWLWEQNRIRHFHVNDYNGGYMEWDKLKTLPLGKGRVDFERFFGFVKAKGYTGNFTVEATALRSDGFVDFEMLNDCVKKIKKYLE